MTNREYIVAFLIYLGLGLCFGWLARCKKIYNLAALPNVNIQLKDISITLGGVVLIFFALPYIYRIYPFDYALKLNSVIFIWINFTFIYTYISFRKLNKSLFKINRKLGLGFVTFLLSLPWGAMVALASDFIVTNFYSQSLTLAYTNEASNNLFLFLLVQFSVIFIVPVYEEILFRGIVQNYLARVFGNSIIGTIFLTSSIFTFVHYRPSLGISNLQALPGVFVSSIFISYLYYKTRSLTSCICFHIAQNFLSRGS